MGSFATLFVTLYSLLIFVSAENVLRGNSIDGSDYQLHISQGKTPESMMISWHTAELRPSEVRYGLSAKELVQSAVVSEVQEPYVAAFPGFSEYTSGYFHHVEITGLSPDTEYFYQVGDFANKEVSDIHSFTTLHAVGDLSEMHFGIVGDLGQTSDSLLTVKNLYKNRHLSSILHVGDLGYADCNQELWDDYGKFVEFLAATRPWMVGAGNHEVESGDAYGGNFKSFEARYRMPHTADEQLFFGDVTIPSSDDTGSVSCASSVFQMEYNYGNSFYSYEFGGAHVITLNCYSTSDSNSVQYKWLENDLKSVDRTKTPWVYVSMHCPWYNSNIYHHDEIQAVEMKASMEQLLYENNVNFAFVGHVHAYERTIPVFQNNSVPDGITYVTIGDGGNAEGHAADYYEPAPDWTAYRNGTQFGHGIVTIHNETHMEWQWHRNIDGLYVMRDRVTVCNVALGLRSDCRGEL